MQPDRVIPERIKEIIKEGVLSDAGLASVVILDLKYAEELFAILRLSGARRAGDSLNYKCAAMVDQFHWTLASVFADKLVVRPRVIADFYLKTNAHEYQP